MRRWLIVLATLLVAAAGVAAANDVPRAWAGDAPIGHIGDTLRVDTAPTSPTSPSAASYRSIRRRDLAIPAAASRSKASPTAQ